VEVRDAPVLAIDGARGAFRVRVGEELVETRRVLLATGMIDELPAIEGFRELWGHSIYQCPYCHGWEAQDTTWGYLAHDTTAPHLVMFLLMLRAWTRDVVVFTGHATLPAEVRARLTAAGVRVQPGEVKRLSGEAQQLTHVELADGTRVPCAALFAHPPQRQVPLVHALGLALDADGFVKADAMTRETSVPGIYASGDLTSRMQSALAAAAAGQLAGSMLNMELTNRAGRGRTAVARGSE
jgi:thioredoxin reductase